MAGSKDALVDACQLKVLVTPVVCQTGGLHVSVELSVGVIEKPTPSIVGPVSV